jgi:hypothetical protein
MFPAAVILVGEGMSVGKQISFARPQFRYRQFDRNKVP